jgi:hypothetical protein
VRLLIKRRRRIGQIQEAAHGRERRGRFGPQVLGA